MGKRTVVNQGDRYGRLTISHEIEKRFNKRYFICVCDCGNKKDYRLISLLSGKTKSCGCLRDEQNRTVAITHSQWNTRLYSIWHSMKQRCLNSNCKKFEYYGGRGISIYKEWIDSFERFYNWAISNGYEDNLTIDRKDFNGNYEPNNCRWATIKQQARNRSDNVMIEFNGERKCRMDWALQIGISNTALVKRLKNWTLEEALTKPKTQQ